MLLPDIQRCFATYALRDIGIDQISAYVKDNGLSAMQRLSVYRNNTQLGLSEALRDGYPVVNKLIGKDCFNQLARDYIWKYPPTAGCLLTFGRHLAEFIEGYPALTALTYLADVARLEWYWHEAFHEADAKAFLLQDLSQIKPEHYADSSLLLQPSARLLTSEYPILPIWQSNQDNYAGDVFIDINQGGSRVLILRPALEVQVFSLTTAEYRFLLTLRQGLPLTEAVTEAFNEDNTFDVFAVLQRWFVHGLFTGFITTTLHHQEFKP